MAVGSEFEHFLTTLSEGGEVSEAISTLVEGVEGSARLDGALEANIAVASDAFKKALLHAIDKGLTLEQAYKHALASFESLLGQKTELPLTPEQKLFNALVSGSDQDGILAGNDSPVAGDEDASGLTVQFVTALVKELSEGKSTKEAVKNSKEKIEAEDDVAKLELEFLETSPAGKLLAALNSGDKVDAVLNQIAKGGSVEDLEQSLSSGLASGGDLKQATEKASRNAELAKELDAQAGDNLAVALASGQKVEGAIKQAGGGDNPEQFEQALSQNLQSGASPDNAADSAATTAENVVQAEANAEPSLVAALATGQSVSEAIENAGGDEGGSFEQKLAQNLAAGADPGQAASKAQETASSEQQAEQNAEGNLVLALASGQSVEKAISEAAGSSDGENFEQSLAQNLQSGESPTKAAFAAAETAETVEQVAASEGTQQVAAMQSDASDSNASNNADSDSQSSESKSENENSGDNSQTSSEASSEAENTSSGDETDTSKETESTQQSEGTSEEAVAKAETSEPTDEAQPTEVAQQQSNSEPASAEPAGSDAPQPEPTEVASNTNEAPEQANVEKTAENTGQSKTNEPVAEQSNGAGDASRDQQNTETNQNEPVEVASASELRPSLPDTATQPSSTPAEPDNIVTGNIPAQPSTPASSSGQQGQQSGSDFVNPFVQPSFGTPGFSGSSFDSFSSFGQPSEEPEPTPSFDFSPPEPEVVEEIVVSVEPPPPPANIAPDTTSTTATGLEDAKSIAVSLSGSDPDGTVSSFRLTKLPVNGTLYTDASFTVQLFLNSVIVATSNSATIHFVPDGDYFGTQELSYVAIDNTGAADSTGSTASIEVVAVNDNPVASPLSLAVDEDDSNITLDLLQGAGDVDETVGLSVGASSVSGLQSGLTLNGNVLEIDPGHADFQSLAPGDVRTINVNYTILDSDGGSVAQTATITVTGTNDAPILSATQTPLANATEDQSYVISLNTLLENISDVDLGTSTIGSISVSDGTLTSLPDGSYTYQPDSDFSGQITLNYVVEDGQGGSLNVSRTLVIDPVSDAPALSVSAASGDEDSSIALSIAPSVTDASESITGVTISGIPTDAVLTNTAGDTITIAAGKATLTAAQVNGLAITPPANFDGSFDLTVTATSQDGSAAEATSSAQTLSVTVNAVSDAPTLSVSTASGDEDSSIALSIAPSVTDASESITGVTISGIPTDAVLTNTAGDTITIIAGKATLTAAQLNGLAITPPANFGGSFDLTVTATSQDGSATEVSSSAQTLSVTVNPVNDAPEIAASVQTGTITEPRDPSAPAELKILNNQRIEVLPSIGESGPNAGDDGDVRAEPTIVSLSNGNYVVAWEQWYTTADARANTVYSVFDSQGNVLTGPAHIHDNIGGDQGRPQISALDDGGFIITWHHGYGTIRAQQYDVSGQEVGAEFEVGVKQGVYVDNPAVIQLSSGKLVFAWADAAGKIGFTTIQNDAPTFAGGTKTSWDTGTLPVTSSSLLQLTSWKNGASEGVVLAWAETDGTINMQRYSDVGVAQEDAIQISANAKDPSVASLSDGGFVVAFVENEIVKAQVFDGDGTSRSTLTIDDSSATAGSPNVVGLSDGRFAVTWQAHGDIYAQAFNSNGDAIGSPLLVNEGLQSGTERLSYRAPAITELSDGSIAISWADPNGQTALYVTKLGDPSQGVDGLRSEGTITFADADTGDRPSASKSVSSIEARDDSGQPLTLTEAQRSAIEAGFSISEGAGNANSGSVDWSYLLAESAINFLGEGESITATFAITLDDGNGGADSRDVTITINGANDAPATIATSASGAEDASSIAISLSGSDIDGTVSSFKINSLPADGVLYSDAALTNQISIGDSVSATGNAANVYFVPNANFNGTPSFTFTAVDNNGLEATSPATASITVTAVNDAPVLTSNAQSTFTENGSPVVLNANLSVSDVDGDNLTGATIKISSGYQQGADSLNFQSQNGISGTFDSATGILTLTGDASVADYQAALRSITFSNNSDNPTAETRSFTFVVSDGVMTNADAPATTSDTDVHFNGLVPDNGYSDYPAGLNTDGLTFTVPGSFIQAVGGTFGGGAWAHDGSTAINSAYGNNPTIEMVRNNGANFVVKSLSVKAIEAAQNVTVRGFAADGSVLFEQTYSFDHAVPQTLNPPQMLVAKLTVTGDHSSTGKVGIDNIVYGDTPDASTTIDVTPVNDAPTSENVSATGPEDAASISVALAGSDIDGTVASFTIKSLPADGTLYSDAALTNQITIGDSVAATGNAASVYFVPNANYNGTPSFTFAAVDNNGLEATSSSTATIAVTSVNDAPVIAPGSQSGTITEPKDPAIPTNLELLNNQRIDVLPSLNETGPNAGDDGDVRGYPTIVTLSNGNYVVAWEQWWTTADQRADTVYSVFDSQGTVIAGPAHINNSKGGDQGHPQLSALDDGGFIATWHHGEGTIRAQQFDASGQEVGVEFEIGVKQGQYVGNPSVIQLDNGMLVFAWADLSGKIGFKAVQDDASTYSGGTQSAWETGPLPVSSSSLFELASWKDAGAQGIVLIWTETNGVTKMQRYSDAGVTQGSAVQISANAKDPSVASLSDGGYAAVFVENEMIKAHIFDGNGATRSLITIDNSPSVSGNPNVVGLSDGRFVVTWQSFGDIYAQAFKSDGASIGSPLLVNEGLQSGTELLSYRAPAITELNDGSIAITWADPNGQTALYVTKISDTAQAGSGSIRSEGTIAFTDVDAGDAPTASKSIVSIEARDENGNTFTLSEAQKDAIEAGFSINEGASNSNNGSINWVYEPAESAINFLSAGETITATFSISVDDGNLGSDSRDVSITINGSDDAPYISSDDGAGNVETAHVLNLDGTGDHVNAGNVAQSNPETGDMTVELWFLWDGSASAQTQYLVSKGAAAAGNEGWSISLDASGNLALHLNAANSPSDAQQAGTQIDMNSQTVGWHHVAMVVSSDGSTATVTGYLNGSTNGWSAGAGADTDGSLNVGAEAISNNDPLIIGATDSDGAASGTTIESNFQGAIDEVRIWDTARTAQEVNDVMNQTLTGTENGLSGIWSFNGDAKDGTSNNNDGVVSGDPVFEDQTEISVASNGTYQALLLGTDPDSVGLSYAAGSAPTDGLLTVDGPRVTYTHTGSGNSDSFSVSLDDGSVSTTEDITVGIV